MITLQTAQNALKTVYLEAISNQLNNKIDPVFSMIKQSSTDVYGRNIIKLVPFGLNGGIGAGTEDGLLPESCDSRYVNFSTTLKNLYGTIEISDKAIRASTNDEGAFVNLLTAEMDGLLQSSKFNISRMFYGDGSGEIGGTITAVDTSNKTIKVTNATGFMEGMLLDFYLSDVLDAGMQGVEVLRVDRANGIVYLSAVSSSLTSSSMGNYTICVQGSKDKEITGLGAIFGESETLYGLNRAEYASLMPYKYAKKSSETLDEMFIQKMMDNIENKSNYQPNVILCGGDMIYTVMGLLAGYTKNLDTTHLNGGFTSVSFCGVPLLRNRFETTNNFIMLNTNEFTLHQLCDWEWLTHSDGSILKQKEGYATYSATLVKYADLVCNRPNAQGIITV
ncbi:MAG: phage major capsid protein [Clostridia bacterium]|nr:phage major capsid protein [Clostridia bacterium]